MLSDGGFEGEVYSLGEWCIAPDMDDKVGAVLLLMIEGRPGWRTLGTAEEEDWY